MARKRVLASRLPQTLCSLPYAVWVFFEQSSQLRGGGRVYSGLNFPPNSQCKPSSVIIPIQNSPKKGIFRISEIHHEALFRGCGQVRSPALTHENISHNQSYCILSMGEGHRRDEGGTGGGVGVQAAVGAGLQYRPASLRFVADFSFFVKLIKGWGRGMSPSDPAMPSSIILSVRRSRGGTLGRSGSHLVGGKGIEFIPMNIFPSLFFAIRCALSYTQ